MSLITNPSVTQTEGITHLEIRAEVLGDVGRVTLREDRYLLLNVLNLVLGLLQVHYLDGHNLTESGPWR